MTELGPEGIATENYDFLLVFLKDWSWNFYTNQEYKLHELYSFFECPLFNYGQDFRIFLNYWYPQQVNCFSKVKSSIDNDHIFKKGDKNNWIDFLNRNWRNHQRTSTFLTTSFSQISEWLKPLNNSSEERFCYSTKRFREMNAFITKWLIHPFLRMNNFTTNFRHLMFFEFEQIIMKMKMNTTFLFVEWKFYDYFSVNIISP